MKRNVLGVHHIALKAEGVAAFEKTLGFYRDVLTLPVVRTWGEGEAIGAMLALGDGYMELFSTGTDSPTGGAVRHFALRVTDVDALIARVREAGYTVTTEPKDIVIPSEIPLRARIAFCIGPVGEEIEFFCEK